MAKQAFRRLSGPIFMANGHPVETTGWEVALAQGKCDSRERFLQKPYSQ